MTTTSATNEFLARLQSAMTRGALVKLTLGGYHGPDPGLKNLFVRPVTLRSGPHWSFVYRYLTRDTTKNYSRDEALARVATALGPEFTTAHLFTIVETVELTLRAGHQPRLVCSKPVHQAPATGEHDRRKPRLIDPGTNPWLHALGITTATGVVREGMAAKFRQINKFVELLQPLLAGLPVKEDRAVRLVDMGCGKGYLTFAACALLQRAGWKVDALGFELRPALVAQANATARQFGFDGLRFEDGTIAGASVADVDVLVALHACDTATDDALAKGVQAGAALLLAAPCCHKELRPQLRPPPVLAGALQHGILRERQAEFVTDALRAAVLEWAGYQTKVFEFIATEHTAKNLMIAAVKTSPPAASSDCARRARELAAFYGIRRQRLADQLGLDLGVGDNS